ncbi:MAG TPA: alpha-E domain-containing protein, partial [Burkholderiales bacterium]|nr:alpha-E domain-containing protein [Burkholderiales bacterium]
LTITAATKAYFKRHETLSLSNLIDFMGLDADNPSSIYACIESARDNAHAVRWQITSEMWETLNATWIEMRSFQRANVTGPEATRFFDWVKERSHLFRGVTYGTIMRGEAFNFSRLGTFLERADDTARILDVKYHILLPRVEDVGGALDYYQWAALLKSVSSFETYRIIYRDQIRPINVAELLILDRRMPRSLAACLEQIDQALSRVEGQNDQPAKRLAGELQARLVHGDIDEIFRDGLHEYLTTFLEDIDELGYRISRAYLGAL